MSRIALACCLFVIATLAACADTATCGEGQTKMGDYCVKTRPVGDGDGDGGGDGDAGTAPPDAGDDGTLADNWGAACEDDVDHTDCVGMADYCARTPSGDAYCSATGCKEAPETCPMGWGCLDLSGFDPKLPSVCTKP